MITDFGKNLRKIRIDLGITLYQMAETTNVSPAFLSSIETGKKPVPDGYVATLAENYSCVMHRIDEFKRLAAQTKKEVKIKINHQDQSGSELVMAFARRFSELTEDQKTRIQAILKADAREV